MLYTGIVYCIIVYSIQCTVLYTYISYIIRVHVRVKPCIIYIHIYMCMFIIYVMYYVLPTASQPGGSLLNTSSSLQPAAQHAQARCVTCHMHTMYIRVLLPFPSHTTPGPCTYMTHAMPHTRYKLLIDASPHIPSHPITSPHTPSHSIPSHSSSRYLQVV
jgi:hypothetical protein